MRTLMWLSLLAATGCEQDLVAEQADAAVDSITLPAGLDWSCIDTPAPTTAPDPLRVSGFMGVPDATVEVHAVADDALLGQGTTGSSASTNGKYAIDIANGGVARDMYRKGSKTGYQDILVYDPFAADRELFWRTPMASIPDPAFVTVWGGHPDPTKGSIWFVVTDCKLPPDDVHPVAGAAVEVPPGTHRLYLDAQGYVSDADKLLTATTASGIVAIDDLDPGTYDIPVHIGGYTYRSRPVTVRANTWTLAIRTP